MEWNLHVWVLTSLHALVFLLGVPGNALIIRVFAKKQRKSSTHIFILGLAIADLYVCLTTAAMIAYWFFEYDISSTWVCAGGYYSLVLGVYYSLFVTTVIAVERYYAVCEPHKKIVTPFRARVAVIVSVIAAAVVSAPSVLFSDVIEGTIVEDHDDGPDDGYQTNSTVNMCWPAPDDVIEWVGASAMYSIYVVSLVLVACLYAKVYTTIRDKVLGPTPSTRIGASMRSLDSTSRRSSTPLHSLSRIEEAETDQNHDQNTTSRSPSKSNGSANHIKNDHISPKPSPSKSNGSVKGIVVEGDTDELDNGSTKQLVKESKKDEQAYSNAGLDLKSEEDDAKTEAPSKESANHTISKSDLETPAISENKGEKTTDTNEHGSVTNGVKNGLAVTPSNTAPSSPAASPRKGPVVIDPNPTPVFENRHFEPIKYDNEFGGDDKDLKRGGKRQSSLMSFRGFLSRPLGSISGGSFNSQASTRSVASQRMQNKTTNMLLLVTIVTYVTWIPTLISSVILIETPDTRDQRFSETVITILLVMKMMFVVNHAANPFIYTIVNDRFRKDCLKELRLIFGCSEKRRF